jgi:ABC-2 type transport system permease protein
MEIINTRPRQGRWNILGTWALYRREVLRFCKIAVQAFFAPVITSLLFLAIFNLAFSGQGRSTGGIPFIQFLVPGLALMAMMNASFANASFSLMFEKVVETIVDTLMPPMSAGELTVGYVLASTTRGLLVGVAVIIGMAVFTTIQIHSWFFILFHAVAASLLMAVLGLVTGIWAEKFEHVASVNNFVILPLTFLSGTFYSIQNLPEAFQTILYLNPFFYVIDGFRYGFVGVHDSNLLAGVVLLISLIVFFWCACVKIFGSGYKLKS